MEVTIHTARWKHIGSPAQFHKTGRHVFEQRALDAGVEVTEQIESLQQFGRGQRGMELKMGEQQRCEPTYAAESFIEERARVNRFRLSECLRLGHGRFKREPWHHGLDGGKCSSTSTASETTRRRLPRVRHRHSAFSPVSPVLIRTSSLMPPTKIIPSPALPVCELRIMVSITPCVSSSPTITRMFTMGTNSGVNSAPR